MCNKKSAIMLVIMSVMLIANPAQARKETFSTKLKQSWTIEQAYDSLSMRPIIFNETISRIPDAEKAYIKQLFEILDAAIIERALALVNFRVKKNGYNERNYKAIMEALQKLPPPTAGLHKVQYLLMQAITEQQHYLAGWAQNPRLPFDDKHPMMRSSHLKIQRATQKLMQLYLREAEYNRRAFQTHLEALNFMN